MTTKTTYALAALPHRSIKDTKVINLRVTTNRKPKYKSLKINIQSKNWDQKNQKVKGGKRGEANADIINDKIEKILLKAQTDKTNNIGDRENSFIDYANYIIKSTHSNGTKGNRLRAIKKLRVYLEHNEINDLPFNKLDNIFIEGYYSWLLNDGGLKTSTANEYMQIISQVVDKTIQSGKHQFRVHPFINYTRKRTETLIEVLDDSDLKKLMDYQPKSEKQRTALHIFFFMMHLSGIRISDALKLTFNKFYIDGKGRFMVKYKAQKSGNIVTTKVSVKAALEMSSFLYGYGHDEKIKELHEVMREYLSFKEELEEYVKERGNIIPSTLQAIQKYFNEESNQDKQNWLLDREVKKEMRKEHLRFEIIHLEKKCEETNNKLLSIISDIVLTIKEEHPNDTIIPYMRGIYKGEEKCSDEVEALSNNFKTKNNKMYKTIGKKVGIKKNISNHQARHVFAMRLFLKNVNMHHISLALGHSSIATTDKYRQKLIDDTVHDITDDFSETFDY